MFFSRMVSNLLSSKNSNSSKTGKKSSTFSILASDETEATKPLPERISKDKNTEQAHLTILGTSKLEQDLENPIKMFQKEEKFKNKVTPQTQSKHTRKVKTGFMGLKSKKKTLKKRGIKLPIVGINSIVGIGGVDEPSTSASAPAFNSVWRPGTLYSDVVSGAGPSSSKKPNDIEVGKVTHLPNITTPGIVAPLNVIIADVPQMNDGSVQPDHLLFPSLGESYKCASAHLCNDGETEQLEDSKSLGPLVTGSHRFFELTDNFDAIATMSSVSSEGTLSLKFSDISINSNSTFDFEPTTSLLSSTEPIIELPADSSNEDDNLVVSTVMASEENDSKKSEYNAITTISTQQETNFLTSSSLLALPKWNFTPPTECSSYPSGMGMFNDERYLYYERLSWLGLKLAMGDKKW